MHHVMFFTCIYPMFHHAEMWHKAILKCRPRSGQDLCEAETKILGTVTILLIGYLRRRAIKDVPLRPTVYQQIKPTDRCRFLQLKIKFCA